VILLIGAAFENGAPGRRLCFYTYIRNNPLTRDYAFWSLVAALLDGRRMRCGRRGSCQAHRHFGEQNWRGRPGPLLGSNAAPQCLQRFSVVVIVCSPWSTRYFTVIKIKTERVSAIDAYRPP